MGLDGMGDRAKEAAAEFAAKQKMQADIKIQQIKAQAAANQQGNPGPQQQG